eukprot:2421100-Lingulodinium_polyedra.AAC.1
MCLVQVQRAAEQPARAGLCHLLAVLAQRVRQARGGLPGGRWPSCRCALAGRRASPASGLQVLHVPGKVG